MLRAMPLLFVELVFSVVNNIQMGLELQAGEVSAEVIRGRKTQFANWVLSFTNGT